MKVLCQFLFVASIFVLISSLLITVLLQMTPSSLTIRSEGEQIQGKIYKKQKREVVFHGSARNDYVLVIRIPSFEKDITRKVPYNKYRNAQEGQKVSLWKFRGGYYLDELDILGRPFSVWQSLSVSFVSFLFSITAYIGIRHFA